MSLARGNAMQFFPDVEGGGGGGAAAASSSNPCMSSDAALAQRLAAEEDLGREGASAMADAGAHAGDAELARSMHDADVLAWQQQQEQHDQSDPGGPTPFDRLMFESTQGQLGVAALLTAQFVAAVLQPGMGAAMRLLSFAVYALGVGILVDSGYAAFFLERVYARRCCACGSSDGSKQRGAWCGGAGAAACAGGCCFQCTRALLCNCRAAAGGPRWPGDARWRAVRARDDALTILCYFMVLQLAFIMLLFITAFRALQQLDPATITCCLCACIAEGVALGKLCVSECAGLRQGQQQQQQQQQQQRLKPQPQLQPQPLRQARVKRAGRWSGKYASVGVDAGAAMELVAPEPRQLSLGLHLNAADDDSDSEDELTSRRRGGGDVNFDDI